MAVVFLDEWELAMLASAVQTQRDALAAYEDRVGLEHEGKERLALTDQLLSKLQLAVPPKKRDESGD